MPQTAHEPHLTAKVLKDLGALGAGSEEAVVGELTRTAHVHHLGRHQSTVVGGPMHRAGLAAGQTLVQLQFLGAEHSLAVGGQHANVGCQVVDADRLHVAALDDGLAATHRMLEQREREQERLRTAGTQTVDARHLGAVAYVQAVLDLRLEAGQEDGQLACASWAAHRNVHRVHLGQEFDEHTLGALGEQHAVAPALAQAPAGVEHTRHQHAEEGRREEHKAEDTSQLHGLGLDARPKVLQIGRLGLAQQTGNHHTCHRTLLLGHAELSGRVERRGLGAT
mmetsp:Transcript_26140/g.65711  ORF Transcript_26140/g.65711 Transcript_26140/m.65711 type:complete len:280 (-) Transcript_26140:2867-3706(-)